MAVIPEEHQFYQTNLERGKLYKLVKFNSSKGTQPNSFYLLKRVSELDAKSDDPNVANPKVLCEAPVEDASVLYVESVYPDFDGSPLDKFRVAIHKVVYGEVIGWLDGRWFLLEDSVDTVNP